MPRWPANGARRIFLSRIACCCATCALAFFRLAASVSECGLADRLDLELLQVALDR